MKIDIFEFKRKKKFSRFITFKWYSISIVDEYDA